MIKTLIKFDTNAMVIERGEDKINIYWGIDMNKSHWIYLGMY